MARHSQTLNGQMLRRKLLSWYKSHPKPPFWENSARDFRRQDLLAPSLLSFSIFQGTRKPASPQPSISFLAKVFSLAFTFSLAFEAPSHKSTLIFHVRPTDGPSLLGKGWEQDSSPILPRIVLFFSCWETPDLKEGIAGTFSHPAPFILHRREPGCPGLGQCEALSKMTCRVLSGKGKPLCDSVAPLEPNTAQWGAVHHSPVITP